MVNLNWWVHYKANDSVQNIETETTAWDIHNSFMSMDNILQKQVVWQWRSCMSKCKTASLYLTLRCLLTEMLFWKFSEFFSFLRHLEDNFEYFRADHVMNLLSITGPLTNVDLFITTDSMETVLKRSLNQGW